MKKYVAFDVGNVLCRVDLDPFYNMMVEKGLAETPDLAKDFLDSVQGPQDVGLYSITQAIRRFFPKIDGKSVGDIYAAWMESVDFSKPMVALIEELLDYNYKIALLSNIGADHAEIVRDQAFTGKCIQHFSYEVGARKPTALYFQSFLMKYDKWKESFFFDDKKENIEASEIYAKLRGVLFDLEDFPSDKQAALEVKRRVFPTVSVAP